MIGNCSGFYGDRLSAMREMLEGAPDGPALDVLTGDYLAELTMLILGKDAMKDPSLGYARTFVRRSRTVSGSRSSAASRSSATPAGSSPAGLAARLARSRPARPRPRSRARRGRRPPRAGGRARRGRLTANAYLGGRDRAALTGVPTSSSPVGSPTPRWWSVPRSPASAGRPRRTTSWPAPWSRATCWSAAPRPPAGTSPGSAACRAPGPAARLPDRRDRATGRA